MNNDNKDILDLCRLNLMEENISDSPSLDRDITMKAIEVKKRELATKITGKLPPIADDVMEKHICNPTECRGKC